MSGLPSYESLYPSNGDEPPSYFENPKGPAEVWDITCLWCIKSIPIKPSNENLPLTRNIPNLSVTSGVSATDIDPDYMANFIANTVVQEPGEFTQVRF